MTAIINTILLLASILYYQYYNILYYNILQSSVTYCTLDHIGFFMKGFNTCLRIYKCLLFVNIICFRLPKYFKLIRILYRKVFTLLYGIYSMNVRSKKKSWTISSFYWFNLGDRKKARSVWQTLQPIILVRKSFQTHEPRLLDLTNLEFSKKPEVYGFMGYDL